MVTNLNERGFFQIHPDESKDRRFQHERLTTDPDYSVQAGIRNVRFYADLARQRFPSIPEGSELFWRIVKLQHAMGSGLVRALLGRMRASNIALSWEAKHCWERWREQTRMPASAGTIEEAERLVKPQEKTVYEVVKGGGRVVAGTDAPINPYGLSLLMELENYADGGLSPIEVLRTATSVSADAMGAGAEIGSIEPGKLADITIVDGNPLASIRELRKVTRVMKDGKIYEVDALLKRQP